LVEPGADGGDGIAVSVDDDPAPHGRRH
jgi:hypothetical protein